MNVQEYISSGILELYVAGSLSYDEMRDVERYAEQYPEVRAELNEIERSLEHYALAHSLSPRPERKESVMNAISAETEKAITTHAEVLAMQPKPVKRTVSFYLAAASLLLMLGSLGAAGFFYLQWQKSQEELLALQGEREKLMQDMSLVQNSVKSMNYDLGIIVHKNTKAVPVRGTKAAPQAAAVVYWNSVTKDVYINIEELPPAPSGMEYQLWALKSGKPVFAGVVDPNAKDVRKMPPTERPEAFMVTLEQKGNVQSPSKDRLYLTGKM